MSLFSTGIVKFCNTHAFIIYFLIHYETIFTIFLQFHTAIFIVQSQHKPHRFFHRLSAALPLRCLNTQQSRICPEIPILRANFTYKYPQQSLHARHLSPFRPIFLCIVFILHLLQLFTKIRQNDIFCCILRAGAIKWSHEQEKEQNPGSAISGAGCIHGRSDFQFHP